LFEFAFEWLKSCSNSWNSHSSGSNFYPNAWNPVRMIWISIWEFPICIRMLWIPFEWLEFSSEVTF